jgi:predicted amidophosphoribosyltransferase
MMGCGRGVQMPTVQCPDCGSMVSDQAQSCPHCGRPMKRQGGSAVHGKSEGCFLQTMNIGCVIMIGIIVMIVILAVASSASH